MIGISSETVSYTHLDVYKRQALASDPEFLILDEPFNGLDPQGTADLRQLIVSLNQQGMTILISSHLLDELSRLATHYGFIDHGTLIQELKMCIRDSRRSVR